MKGKILFICGSRNQTTQMHQIASHLAHDHDCWFSPHYASGHLELLRKMGLTEMSILGKPMVDRCIAYCEEHRLRIDYRGEANTYDLVLTCADLVVPENIRHTKLILVQEGMTDPENLAYHLAKWGLLPRWAASTATMGLSDAYDKFCVASEGYRDLFIRKGIRPEKLVVTGIPNFDNCAQYLDNTFPHRHFVLVCTSDARDTFKYENRKRIILDAVALAAGRQLIFKLHPNENHERAIGEIMRYAPGALVVTSGNASEMIANCDVLITQYSSTVYVGLALGKEVYSKFPIDELRRLLPLQNNSAARNIALECRSLLNEQPKRPGRYALQRDTSSRMKEFSFGAVFACCSGAGR